MFNHGIRVQEVPTTIIPPVNTQGCLPVFFGTAPLHLAKNPTPVNTPVLCYTYQEAVEALGYSDDWEKYTLCEAIYSQFALFATAPVVFVNVLDPKTHKDSAVNQSVAVINGVGTITDPVLVDTLVVKSSTSGSALTKGTDYTVTHDDVGNVLVHVIPTGSANSASNLYASFDKLEPTRVTKRDIIGGVDNETGAYKGLEALNSVFSKFSIVPGQIAAPGWSHDPEVAAIMSAKVSNVNGMFTAIAHTDIPTDTVKSYSAASEWKKTNNYTSKYQVAYWPKVKLGGKTFHMSTQAVGVAGTVEASNGDIPFESPSNKPIKGNGLCLKDGTEVIMQLENANYLNSQGIVTAMNMVGGWRLWGNEMACYPANTDPKDRFICVRKMFNWHAQTFIQTYFEKVDNPLRKRLIDTIVDSENIRLNGLVGQEALIAGRVEFRQLDNPITNLIDGIATFYTYLTPPVPAREIVNKIEFDPMAYKTLFQ